MHPSHSTWTWTEILSTVGLLPSLWYAAQLSMRALQDYMFLRKNKINGIRDYASFTTIISYTQSAVFTFGLFILGCVSLVAPPANPSKPVTSLSIFYAVFMVSIGVVTALMLHTVERRREILVTKLREIEENKE